MQHILSLRRASKVLVLELHTSKGHRPNQQHTTNDTEEDNGDKFPFREGRPTIDKYSDFLNTEIIFEIEVDDLGVDLFFGDDGEILVESEFLYFVGEVFDEDHADSWFGVAIRGVGEIEVIVVHDGVIDLKPAQKPTFFNSLIILNSLVINIVIAFIISKRAVITGGVNGE